MAPIGKGLVVTGVCPSKPGSVLGAGRKGAYWSTGVCSRALGRVLGIMGGSGGCIGSTGSYWFVAEAGFQGSRLVAQSSAQNSSSFGLLNRAHNLTIAWNACSSETHNTPKNLCSGQLVGT